jgi:hypothetical protein
MKRSLTSTLLLAALLAFSPRVIRAGDDDDQKQKEKDWKKLEEQQKKGGEAPKGADGQGGGEETPNPENPLGDNPLAKILDLMKEAETRLNDTDLDEVTQKEQKKIVEAMKFEDKSKAALDDLIKKIEDMQNQQQQQQQNQKNQSQQQKQSSGSQSEKNETPEQKKQRERQEKQRQQKEKQDAERKQRQNPNQKPDPRDAKNKDQQKKQQQAGKTPPPDSSSPPDSTANDKNRWGDLPAKLHEDADRARGEKIPERWRDQFEHYSEKLSE